MKNSKTILKHLNIPNKDKFDTHRCLNLIVSFLDVKYKRYIHGSELKGETLYLKVSHNILKMERLHILNSIKSVLGIIKMKNRCQKIKITKLFINVQTLKKPVTKPPKYLKYYIHKVDDFEIKATNPKIKKKFEEIKKILTEGS